MTESAGLYFVGLRWLSKYKSFFIYGVGEDTEYIADHLTHLRPSASTTGGRSSWKIRREA